jgi:hypothetical protein
MIYYIRLLWPDDDQFLRDLLIPDTLSFLDLHKAIQEALGYQTAEMSSFIITDEAWNKLQELPLVNFEDSKSTSPMDIPLNTYLNDFHQFLYVFDYFSERALFGQIIKTEEDKSQKITTPVLVKSEGNAPEQMKIDLDLGIEDSFDDNDDDLFDDDEFNDTDYFDETEF